MSLEKEKKLFIRIFIFSCFLETFPEEVTTRDCVVKVKGLIGFTNRQADITLSLTKHPSSKGTLAH